MNFIITEFQNSIQTIDKTDIYLIQYTFLDSSFKDNIDNGNPHRPTENRNHLENRRQKRPSAITKNIFSFNIAI